MGKVRANRSSRIFAESPGPPSFAARAEWAGAQARVGRRGLLAIHRRRKFFLVGGVAP